MFTPHEDSWFLYYDSQGMTLYVETIYSMGTLTFPSLLGGYDPYFWDKFRTGNLHFSMGFWGSKGWWLIESSLDEKTPSWMLTRDRVKKTIQQIWQAHRKMSYPWQIHGNGIYLPYISLFFNGFLPIGSMVLPYVFTHRIRGFQRGAVLKP